MPPPPPSPHGRRPLAACLLVAMLPGCGAFVPRSRFEDCHKLSRALQSEVVQLRDAETRLLAQNQDLVDRSLVDQRRVTALEDYVARQDGILGQYQEDRERLAAELDRLIRVVRSPGGVPLALRDRLETFAEAHPGVRLADDGATCLIPEQRLFVPGRAILTPLGRDWLVELAGLLDDFKAIGGTLSVAAPTGEDDALVRASVDGPALARPLGPARVDAVRAILTDAGLDPARFRPAEADAIAPPGRVAIRVATAAETGPGLDDPEATPR